MKQKGLIFAVAIIAILAISLYMFIMKKPEEPLGQEPVGQEPVSEGFMATRIIGQNTLVPGTAASLRIIVFDERGMKPVKGAEITASLVSEGNQDKVKLFEDKTDEMGTLSFNYTVPDKAKGNGSIEIKVKSGSSEKTDNITVTIKEKEPKISLSTDKPLYQPGQTVHIKALSLLIPTLEPMGNKALTIEVIDPKGNKVMKKDGQTSSYGIASCDFNLAREINMGDYTVKISGEGTEAEKKFVVKKYVLPKFKPVLEADKQFYQAGDKIEGHVSAKYFFGKAVSDADVVINVMVCDDTTQQVATLKGKTDKDGTYKFEYEIPEEFTGSAYQQNKASVQLEANVIDKTEHKETVFHGYAVTKDPITVQVMPEGGRVVSNLENNFYILTSYPDGTPCECNLLINLPDGESRQLASDSTGYSVLPYKAKTAENINLSITAQDKKGNKTEKSVNFVAEAKEENILVRTDKTLYSNGDVIKTKILATEEKGMAYLDIINRGQTVFTQVLNLENGTGKATVELPENIFGMVSLNAYFVSPYTGIVQDNLCLYIAPKDLNVSVELDKKTYKPGEEATLKFNVTDEDGQPVPSAIGVDVVDESLFAIFERKPGMEKIYFLVNPEFLKDPYAIQGLNMGDLIMQSETEEARSDTFAKVVIAQSPQISPYTVDQDSYSQKKQKILADLHTLIGACITYQSQNQKYPEKVGDLVKANLAGADITKDPWGKEYIIKQPEQTSKHEKLIEAALADEDVEVKEIFIEEPGALMPPGRVEANYYYGPTWNDSYPNVICLGGDGELGTADDLDVKSYIIATNLPVYQDVVCRTEELSMDVAMEEKSISNEAVQMEGMVKDEVAMPSVQQPPSATHGTLEGGVEPVKVREYFPETLFSNPEIITDDKGKAELIIPLADSITTWRLSALANSMKGGLGNVTGGIEVFQDFFIDLDLPVKLTRGDEVSIPVSVYNYLPESQTIQLSLEKADWFEPAGEEIQKLTIGKEDVTGTYFRIKVQDVGIHELTVNAKGTSMGDAIKKKIEVVPDGKKYVTYKGDTLLKPGGSLSIEIPEKAIENSSNIIVTVYPRPFSQIVEGMDNIFMMPTGCFEQTSSATYPNVLVLDYMKKTGQISPDVEKRALEYINQGYQSILGYEIDGGGFEVWGSPPATRVLSAYGLMELSDMSEVYQIDTGVLERTKKWLLSQKEPDGSWAPDAQFAHAEQWGDIQSNNIPVTAYIAWAMAESGCKDEIADSIAYLKKNAGQIDNPYILGLCANAFLAINPSDSDGLKILERLDGMKKSDGDSIYWQSDSLYSGGAAGGIETTALIVYAMLKAEKYPDVATKGLNFIIKSKDPYGLWYSTQGTIFAMRALLISQVASPEKVNVTADIIINGEKAETFKVTEENQDVFQQFDLKKYVKNDENKIDIKLEGEGSIAYRVAGIYYLPWQTEESAQKELDIQLNYDRTEVKTTEYVNCKIEVKNLKNAYVPMVMVEAGIPPGFTVMTEDLEKMIGSNTIQKYETYKDKVVIYLNGIDKGKSFTGSYRLLANYPVKAKTPDSRTYLYYTPEINALSIPVTFSVI